MKKNTYSLILSEKVVDEIDRLAKSMNTNRSLLINRILADYASVMTPEKRNNAIFGGITEIVGCGKDFSVYYDEFDKTLSIKSALAFRYRPTIRYEVELTKISEGAPYGYIRLFYRTQAPELLNSLNTFIQNWIRLEKIYIQKLSKSCIYYKIENGRFTRSLAIPSDSVYSVNQASAAISDYILRFDTMLKKWLAGDYATELSLENDYLNYFNSDILPI